jgi:hypothetical protein
LKYTYVIRIVAGLALMGGVMVLSGWVLDISVLKSVIPNEVDVQPSAALCFVCCSVAMYLLTVKRTGMANAVFILACALLMLMGGLTVLDFFTGYDTGYDNLFKPFIHQAFSQIPLRMSPGSAMSFLLLGPGFLLISSNKSYWQRTGQFLLHVITLIAILAIFSYLYSVPYQGRIAIGSPMALRTSLSLLFISTASTLLNPRWGITGTMTGSKMGDMMARRLLPLTLLAIFAIGYLRLQSMRLHLVSDKSAIVLVFVSIFLIALFVILNTAGALNRIDIQRLLAKDEVDSLNKDLESTNDELRLAMQKLELNNQYLEQLAYISAHDIKSPILTLKGLVDVIEKENAVNKEYEPMLKMVTSTIDQMQRTNNALNSILKLRQNLLNTDVRPAEEHS